MEKNNRTSVATLHISTYNLRDSQPIIITATNLMGASSESIIAQQSNSFRFKKQYSKDFLQKFKYRKKEFFPIFNVFFKSLQNIRPKCCKSSRTSSSRTDTHANCQKGLTDVSKMISGSRSGSAKTLLCFPLASTTLCSVLFFG